MDNEKIIFLINAARDARKNSYSPYSKFSVGAALLAENGKVYRGCNVENASFSPTCCAERVALFSAVADGCRVFSAIAVIGDSAPCMPCGVCRQVMSEFCSDSMPIIYENTDGEPQIITLGELLPISFRLKENQ